MEFKEKKQENEVTFVHNPLKEEIVGNVPGLEQGREMLKEGKELQKQDEKDLQVKDQKVSEEELKKAEKQEEKRRRENAFREKFKEEGSRKLSTKSIVKGRTFKTETRITKKHLIKSDETENVKVYAREEAREKLEENAKILKNDVNVIRDMAADLRMNTAIEIKSKCGYDNFNLLSRFYPGFASEMKEDEFKKLFSDYGKDPGAESRFDVMDILTTKIMSIAPRDFDLSTDSKIAEKSKDIETMSLMVESYKELLSGNPEYVKKLKDSKENNVSNYETLAKRLEILSAMSDYYRIRKMIMTDPEYIASDNGIDEEIKDTDLMATRRLKEMMRASYLLSKRLNRLSDSAKTGTIELPELSEGLTEESQKRFKKVDSAISTGKGAMALGTSSESIYEESLKTEESIGELLREFEESGISVASMQMRKDFNLRGSDKEKLSKYAAPYACGSSLALRYILSDYIESKRPGLLEKINKMKTEKLRNSNYVDHSRFPSEKYPVLSKMDISDHLSRSAQHLIMRMMDKSDSEILEAIETINTVGTHEYLAKKDNMSKEEFEFYEDRYADVANETLFRQNANVEKTADAYGMRIFVSHPADYAFDCSDESMVNIGSLSVVSNILQDGNDIRLKEFEYQYLKDKKHKKYRFNIERFIDCGDAMTAMLFKNSVLDKLYEYSINNEDGVLNEEQMEILNEVIGDKLKMEDIEEWAEQPEIKKEIEEYTKVSLEDKNQSRTKFYYYVLKHPEVISKDCFEKLHDEDFSQNMTTVNKDKPIIAMYEWGMAKPPTVSELNDYEKSIKNRKLEKYNYHQVKETGKASSYKLDTKNPYYLKLFYDLNRKKEDFGKKIGKQTYEPFYKAGFRADKIRESLQNDFDIPQWTLASEKEEARPGTESLEEHSKGNNLENASKTIKINGLNLRRMVLLFRGFLGDGYDTEKIKKILEKLDIDQKKQYDKEKDADLIKKLDDQFKEGLNEIKEIYYTYLKRLEATFGRLLTQLHPETVIRMMQEGKQCKKYFGALQDAIQLIVYVPDLFDFEKNEKDREFRNLTEYYNVAYQAHVYKYCVSVPGENERELRKYRGVPKEDIDKIDPEELEWLSDAQKGIVAGLDHVRVEDVGGPYLDETELNDYYIHLKGEIQSKPELKDRMYGTFAKNCL